LNSVTVKIFKEDTCLETRLLLSSIEFEDLSDMNVPIRTKLQEKEYTFIGKWEDAIIDRDLDFFLSATSASDQFLINLLTTTYYDIINEEDYKKLEPKKIKLEEREIKKRILKLIVSYLC
jgi:hypothetical protein